MAQTGEYVSYGEYVLVEEEVVESVGCYRFHIERYPVPAIGECDALNLPQSGAHLKWHVTSDYLVVGEYLLALHPFPFDHIACLKIVDLPVGSAVESELDRLLVQLVVAEDCHVEHAGAVGSIDGEV